MVNYSILETITIVLLALLVMAWFVPGIKAAHARGRQTPADWPAVIIPLGLVALFVFFLILAS